MIYLGPHPSGGLSHRLSRPVIVPTLPVAPYGPDVSGNSMPYWPGYFDINPQARAAYLDWLASGRSDRRYGIGHVFLYFYGLERRFFIDSPESHERRMIIEEVERLIDVYGDNRSVHHYLEAFLDAARTSMGADQELKPTYSTSGYELPLGLRVAIGRRAGSGQTLDADWALSWYYAHPDYTFRTAASRASSEFQALFRVLFAERYPSGLKIPLPKRTLRAEYRAASSEFEIGLDEHIGTVPDISRISQPLNATRTLVEEATDALDKYSRYLGRNPDGRGTNRSPRAVAGASLAPVSQRREGQPQGMDRWGHRLWRLLPRGGNGQTHGGSGPGKNWKTAIDRCRRRPGPAVGGDGT